MRLLILGASGYIGTQLTHYAVDQGHDVVALCRSGHVSGFSGTVQRWTFGDPIPQTAIEGVSCAIHLAHDFKGVAGARLTRDETLACISRLRAGDVRRQLFFSSYSAGEHAISLYGRTKFGIERAISEAPDVVIIRPGLVLGDGGIYGRIRTWAQRLPIVPLPDGGSGQVPIIDIRRLCRETLAIAGADNTVREANLFEKAPKSLRQLVLDAADEVKRHPWIIPVPAKLVLLGLGILDRLHLPTPVNADNLRGFLANQYATHISTFED